MKVEVGRFKDGKLKVKIVFEPNSNFWKDSLTRVSTFEEIDRIHKTLLGIDTINRLEKREIEEFLKDIFVYPKRLKRTIKG